MTSSNADIDLKEIYEFVINLVKEAGVIFVEGYGKKEVEYKDGRHYDIVTKYDKAIETLLIDGITAKYANHK